MIQVMGDEPLKSALEATVAGMEGDAVVIYAEMLTEQKRLRTNYAGLEIALEQAQEGTPVVLLAMSYASMLAAHPEFHLLMSYPHVQLNDAICGAEEIRNAVVRAMNAVRPNDELARKAFALPQMQPSELGGIRHDLGHAQRADEGSAQRQTMDDRWMPRAKKLFGDLSREDLIAAIEAADQPDESYAPLRGQDFADVCCDAEGTLITASGEINPDVRQILDEAAPHRPITIWTGGDLKAVEQKVRKAGIPYKVLPKQLLRGAQVAEAYDDMTQEDFFQQYGVVVVQYHQI